MKEESFATKEPVVTKAPYISGTTLKWTGELEIGTGWGWTGDPSVGITPSVTDEDSTLELTTLEWNDVAIRLEVADIAEFVEPWITVVASETSDGEAREFAVADSEWEVVYAGANCNENIVDAVPVDADTTVISGALDTSVTSYNITAQGRTITAVYVHEKDVDPLNEEKRTTAKSFDVSYNLIDPSWQTHTSETVTITGNGTYAISGITGSDMEDIMMLWLDAGLLGYDNDYNITMESSVIQVGNIVYAASDANWWYKDCDSLEEAQDGTDINESDDMKKNCRRLNYRNQYSNFYDEDGNKIKEKSPVDALSEQEIPATAADTITIYVTVSGMDVDNPEANVKIPDVGIYTSPSPEAPIPTAMPEKTSVAPSYTSIPGIITTPSAIPSAPIESASVPSVSQTPVVTINPPSDVPSPTPNMDLEEDDEDDEYDEDEEEDEDNEDLEEGDTFQKSGFIYTLLNSKSVTVSGYAKNANSLTIASTVTYKSTKYKIVGIESEAFSYMTTLKKITIGANVKSIGKKAFANCKKLKTIEIKSKKIVKVGANAFKNISGSAKIYVPKKKYGAYKALFRKKGQKSSVKIVKGNW